MQTNLNLQGTHTPAFTALIVRDSALQQVGRRVSIRNIDETISRIRNIEQANKNNPINVEIFTEENKNKLIGRLTYDKANYAITIKENALSAFCKRNPINFIKKCCEEAILRKISFQI